MKKVVRKIKNTGHLFLAATANAINAFPSKGQTVIGVTGTDGKTTTSNLLYSILIEAGYKTAVISTIGARINGKDYETGFHVTTPSPFSVQKYLRIAKKEGCTHVILEVTSHALDQNRVWGIKFWLGILTNITHEHLDYHLDYDSYVKAKMRLFKKSKFAIINSDGEWFEYAKKTIPEEKMITYSLNGILPEDLSLLNVPYKIKTKLIGKFNMENILAATAAALALGVKAEVIASAVSKFEAPIGRQEEVGSKNIRVMVDFAHTPNAFESILPELRKRTKGKLIHVFGSAGERDKKKRAVMGGVASYYDDIIILTAEDPRSEKVSKINSEIKSGIAPNKKVFEIEDRKKAIFYAISIAGREDTVVITGKGHEQSMNLGSGEIEWSDQECVKEFFNGKKN